MKNLKFCALFLLAAGLLLGQQNAFMTSPAPNSTIPSGLNTFTWSPASVSGQTYYIWFSQYGANQYDIANYATTATSFTFNVPSTIQNLWVSLWSEACSTCGYTYMPFVFHVQVVTPTFSITSPANGSQLSFDNNGNVTFNFQSNVSPVFWCVGYSGPGSTEVLNMFPVNMSLGSYSISTIQTTATQSAVLNVRLIYSGVPVQDYAFLLPQISGSGFQEIPVSPDPSSDDYSTVPPPDNLPFSANGPVSASAIATTRTVKTSSGTFLIPRGDLLNIGELRYSWSPGSDGNTLYTYTFDNADVANIRLGDVSDVDFAVASNTKPAGWLGGVVGWYAFKGPARSSDAVYSMTSGRRPGLLPMFFQTDVDGSTAAANGSGQQLRFLPMGPKSTDNQIIVRAGSIFTNSQRHFVIGPVFSASPTKTEVLERVQTWVNDYGFTFLAPMLADGADLLAVLDSLSPSSQIEKDVVSCLRDVLPR